MSCAFFPVHFCFYFLLFNMSLYVLGRVTYLANTLVHKNYILCIWMCACTNEPPWTHLHAHMCLGKHRMRDMSFFSLFFFFLRHNIYCDARVYFFGALCRTFIAFGLRCLVQTRDPNRSRSKKEFWFVSEILLNFFVKIWGFETCFKF